MCHLAMGQQHLLLLIVGITLSVFCSAKYLYINPNGVDVGSCNSTNPCQTINYALYNAANNDTIVLDGHLIGNNLAVNKSIIIVSLKEEKPAIVDCEGSRCFIFNEPNMSSNINNIIIQNGNASIGGAVVISNGASPSFNSVAFRNNQAVRDNRILNILTSVLNAHYYLRASVAVLFTLQTPFRIPHSKMSLSCPTKPS